MVELAPIFKRAYWSLAIAGGLYIIMLLCLCNTWLQRFALYANYFHSGRYFQDATSPETFGFAKKQVTPLTITTPDGQSLYAWHVLPVNIYAANEQRLFDEPSLPSPIPSDSFISTVAASLLKEDPDARLVVNFHGNAGHVAQGIRTYSYRNLALLPHTHVLSIDYRGFGFSTGGPSEAGLITDAIATVNFALHELGIPKDRIVVLGQSLGTAVSSSVALHFADPDNALQPPGVVGEVKKDDTQFAAVILVAAFKALPELLSSYRILGIIPILSPLRPYPVIQKIFYSYIVDTWKTIERVKALVRATKGKRLRLRFLHAYNDYDIPWRHSRDMFEAAEKVMIGDDEGKVKTAEWDGGAEVNKLVKDVKEEERAVQVGIYKFGGHNQVITHIPVALAVMEAFESAEKARGQTRLDIE